MSQSGIYSSGGSGGTGITALAGDVGSATGSTVNVITGFTAGPYANGTSSFTGSGNTLQLTFYDANSNIGIGLNSLAGAALVSASGNLAIGNNTASAITGGSNIFIGNSSGASVSGASFNQGIGVASLSSLVGGQNNVAIGYLSGSNLAGVESSNIYLNNPGVLGESNVLRIGGGAELELVKAFIGGIEGISVGSVAEVVAISGDQLGSTTLTAGSGITITPASGTITIAATGGGGGDFVLIQTQTATSQTSLTFTTGITNTYNKYKILFDNVVTATTTNLVLAQISTNGGSSYISTNYFTAGNTSVAGLVLVSMESNGGDAGFTYGDTDLYNLTSGSNYVTASTVASVFYDTTSPGATTPPLAVSAYTVVSTTVNALQIVTDDSTAFSGTFSLYGITS